MAVRTVKRVLLYLILAYPASKASIESGIFIACPSSLAALLPAELACLDTTAAACAHGAISNGMLRNGSEAPRTHTGGLSQIPTWRSRASYT